MSIVTPETQYFVCEAPETCTGIDTQAVTTTYDKLGRPIEYKDADGNVSGFGYDLMGRPAPTSDGKGVQELHYDPISGALTELHDSAAGTFTTTYNADGAMLTESLPNGVTACQKNQHSMYTFHCEPGKEHQFSATWGYNIAFDNDPVPESQLHVSIQQFCL